MAKLGFGALVPLAGVVLGCVSGRPTPHDQPVRIERAGAPEGIWSLGEAGAYFDIRGVEGKRRAVSIPLDERETRWLQPESLRLGYWDPQEKEFGLLTDSRFDPRTKALRATLSRDGLYGIFGYSRWGHVYAVQRRLCGRGGVVRTPFDPILVDELCLVILCPPFDVGAWSRAWEAGVGEGVPAREVGGHFDNLCERCTGGRRIRVPECDIGVIEPEGAVDPPTLEQIPNGIANGGRAVAIAVHPEDEERLVVASETGGLFVSADGGDTWRQTSAATRTFDYSDVEYVPGDPRSIVASALRDTKVANGGGIWRSADGGESWTQIALSPPVPDCAAELGGRALAREGGSERLWAGTTCGLAYSDTGGRSWDYLPAAPGYAHDKVYAVVAPAADDLKMRTDSGVKVSANGGGDWSVSETGLPTSVWNIGQGDHNQIAVSPRDASHIFWAFAYWLWNDEIDDWEPRNGLYLSTDDGESWTAVVDQWGLGRPPFVRVAAALSGDADDYDLYHGDGGCGFRRATVTHGPTPVVSAWTALDIDHCDVSDVAFGNDGATPVLVASDGGLHRTADGGLHWTFTGGGNGGYNALQVTEVTGQLHASGIGADLYFGTQDNDIWASGDSGRTWPGNRCCEGFFLGIPRQFLPASDTRFTAVSCAACGNFMSGPLLIDQIAFPNPPNDAGNPRLLRPAAYVQNTRLPGVDANLYNLTTDTGGLWTPRYGFPEPVRAFPEVAGPAAAPVVFTAFKRPGATPDGEEVLGIKRVSDVLGSGTPTVSEVGDFGSLGIFATMFAWYKPFGVDPADPNFLLVPDILDDRMEVSSDGGMLWTPDDELTDLMTGPGIFRFRWGPFVQASSFGFDPDCPGHILVGTQQAGIFRSFDGGANWARVSGTEVVPRVSSFFFAGGGTAIASSYGRGLWRLRYTCPGAVPPSLDRFRAYLFPVVYLDGVVLALGSIEDAADCTRCAFFLVEGGEILEYNVDAQRQLQGVALSSGRITGFSADGKEVGIPFAVSRDAGTRKLAGDADLKDLLAAGNQIRGVFLEGRRLKGLVVAAREVRPQDLPRRRELAPYLVVELPSNHGVGVGSLKGIRVRGHGFDRDAPLEITLDGVALTLPERLAFDEKGVFHFVLPRALHVGGHTLRVEQRTDRGTFRDAYTFNVAVEDLPRASQEQKPRD